MEQEGEVTDSGCKRQRSSATIKSPNFCRLIVSPAQDTLRIPGKFVKKLGNQLGNIATLTTPNGCIFHVKLERVDGKFCFTDGWHEFVKHQSIGVDYLLIFAYLGNSNLRVNIYDMSNAEVNYRCNTVKGPSHGYQVPVKEEVEEEDCVEILYSPHARQTLTSREKEARSVYEAKVNSAQGDRQHIAKTSDKTPVPCVRCGYILGEPICGYRKPIKKEVEDDDGVEILYSSPPCQTPKSWENKEADSAYRKKAKVNIAGISSSAPSLSCEAKGDRQQSDLMTSGTRLNQRTKKRKQDEHEDSAQKVNKLPTPGAETSSRRSRAILPQERLKVLNASKAFQSVNPFCRVLLRPSYVYKGNSLYMPSSFAEKYLRGASEFLTIKVSCGEEWTIGCTWLNGSAKLSKGWHQFVLANKLKEGNVCVFELIKKVDIVLKLTIFRVAKDAEPEPEEKKRKEKMQNREPAYKVRTRSKSAN